jgi:hypothetical protein
VGVVGTAKWRHSLVGRSACRSSDCGVSPICADDNVGVLDDHGPVLRLPAHAGYATAIPDEVVDGEALPQLGPRRNRGIDQELVEERTARRVRLGNAVPRRRGTEETEITPIQFEAADRWATRGDHPLEQTPVLELATPDGRMKWVESVSLGNFARSTSKTR